MSTPVEIVANYFSAIAEGRIPEAMAALSPEVVWHQPGDNRFSGDHRGPDAVGALIGGMMTVSEGSFAIAPAGPLMANGDLVAAPVHFSGQRGDVELNQSGVDLLRVTEGKIAEVWLFSSDEAQENAFWGA